MNGSVNKDVGLSSANLRQTAHAIAYPRFSRSARGPFEGFEPLTQGEAAPVSLPADWTNLGGDGEKVWGQIALTATKDSPDPTVILLTYSKFEGPVDPAKILELAPNTVLAPVRQRQ